MLVVILLISLLAYLPHQDVMSVLSAKEAVTQEPDHAPFKCEQPAAEQEALIRKAEAEGYEVFMIIFYGLEHTRDRTLRRRLLFNEGDLFTRETLVKSLENLSKSKKIYPVGVSDGQLVARRTGKEKEED